MKKFILSLIVALVTLGASAQGQGPRQWNPEDMAKRQAERIKTACGINDDQYTALYNLYLDQSKKQMAQMDSLRALGNNGGERPRFNREEMQKRREEMNAKIKAILTEEQYAKYEEMQQQQRQRGFGGQGGPRRNQNQ